MFFSPSSSPEMLCEMFFLYVSWINKCNANIFKSFVCFFDRLTVGNDVINRVKAKATEVPVYNCLQERCYSFLSLIGHIVRA
jgi:hypothetical protein